VVADGHPPPAPAADDQTLQQGGAFAGRAGGAVVAAGGGVGGQDGEVGLVLGPGEVPGVVVFDQDRPLRDGPGGGVVVSVQAGGVAGPPVGVGGVVQDAEDPVVGERLEEQLAAAGPSVVPGGEGQLLLAECLDDAERCSYGLSSVWMTFPEFISGICQGMGFGLELVADKTGRGRSGWRASSYEVTPSKSG
jgi:hypothetical protein